MEIHENVNNSGVRCSLHTGQERIEVPHANHIASTVEMCALDKHWSIAVIDEVQLITDESRGWAWTRAFLGLQADEIHLCGDPSTLNLYKRLCNDTNDVFLSRYHERLACPLHIEEEPLYKGRHLGGCDYYLDDYIHNDLVLGGWENIRAGDCIIAFSRGDIFKIKSGVESNTSHKCCAIYGALPPQTRTNQARLFNDPTSGYDVLTATDAIGMGLNLNIRRVIFTTLVKGGKYKALLIPSQVKQIAGRAGRYGSVYEEGRVTTMHGSDIQQLVKCMQQPFTKAIQAGLFPSYEQLEHFAKQFPDGNMAWLLTRFLSTSRFHNDKYFICKNHDMEEVARIVDLAKGISLEDRFRFCFAPQHKGH